MAEAVCLLECCGTSWQSSHLIWQLQVHLACLAQHCPYMSSAGQTQQAFQSAADSLLVPDMPGGAARPHTHYTACCCVRSRAEDLLSRSAFPEVMWIIQTWPAGHHVVLDVARRELYCATCREHKVDAVFDCHLLVSTLRELCWMGWAESPLVGATWQGSQCSLRLSA